MEWVLAALFGGLVGAGELVCRYRDAPVRAVWNRPAAFYIALNMAASAGALALIRHFGWQFGGMPPVLVAGFGAMGLFRTSFFTVRAGDQDIGVGPAAFLQIFLDAADRGVDRWRAQNRAARVSKIMKDVDYAKAFDGLPQYCLSLMRNVPIEDQRVLARGLERLDRETAPDSIRVRVLGLELMNLVGEDVLRDAVNSLGEEIRVEG